MTKLKFSLNRDTATFKLAGNAKVVELTLSGDFDPAEAMTVLEAYGPAVPPPPTPVPEQPDPTPAPQPPVLPVVPSSIPDGYRHIYPQLQAWSPDGTRLLLQKILSASNASTHVFTAATGALAPAGNAPRWWGNKVVSTTSTSVDIDGEVGIEFYEPLAQGASHEDIAGDLLAILPHSRERVYVCNLQDRESRAIDLPPEAWDVNNCVITPTQDAMVIQFNPTGTQFGQGTWVCALDASPIRQLTTRHPHYDLGVLNGRTTFTYEAWYQPNTNTDTVLTRVFVDNGATHYLANTDWDVWHISTRAYGHDVVLVTFTNGVVMALRSGQWVDVCTYELGRPDYYQQPQGSISRDGTKAIVCTTGTTSTIHTVPSA